MATPIMPSRGDVWLAYLGPVVGTEQGGTRPVLIVSTNEFNHGFGSLVITVPITGTPPRFVVHVPLPAGEGGVRNDSTILCDQVRSLSRRRLKRWWGKVSDGTMADVERRLSFLLDF